MKNIIVLDCGPSLKEVSKKFGQSPEWVMATLKNLDINFNWVKLYTGERIDKYKGDAWIITGSPRSVNDEKSWMLNLEDNIRDATEIKKSILGICFGHQLIAKSFGGKVEINPQGWELGSYPIYLTADGASSPLFQGIDDITIVYESHQDSVIELPAKAVELASNKKGIQAFAGSSITES
jgi:GMP synthase (glutamine-hydrolysing)